MNLPVLSASVVHVSDDVTRESQSDGQLLKVSDRH